MFSLVEYSPILVCQFMDLFNAKAILNKQRTVWIDYDKGISIILVSYGHSFAVLNGHGLTFENYPLFNYIGVFLYGFRMPLFFIISGLLIANSLERKGLNGYLKNRLSSILYPLLVWGIIETTIKVLSSIDSFSLKDIGTAYLNLLIDPRKSGVFWYLNALFCIGTLYAVIRVSLKASVWLQLLLGIVMFSLSAYFRLNGVSLGFLSDILGYYVFFAIGDCSSQLLLSEKGRNQFTSAKFYLPVLIVFLITQYYCSKIILGVESSGLAHMERKLPFIFLIQALVGCTLSISLSFMLQKYRWLPSLRIVGFHSLFIYCMQIVVMNFTRIFLMGIIGLHNVPLIFMLTWILGILVPMLVYVLAMHCGMWWLFTFKKPSTKEPAEKIALAA
jgi:fucose 4-O-acetylase-like acetyltransferase